MHVSTSHSLGGTSSPGPSGGEEGLPAPAAEQPVGSFQLTQVDDSPSVTQIVSTSHV